MRRILVENVRRKQAPKHGAGWRRINLDEAVAVAAEPTEGLLEFDAALSRLQTVDLLAARLVELRYFAGQTMEQAARALGVSLRTAERNWTFARTWLHRELTARPPGEG
jgi:RNA polymerase sigma factor (TIGR02999 family)